MEQTNEQMALVQGQVLTPQVLAMQEKFALACQTAQSMQLQNNACAAFQAVCVVTQLRQALTDDVMKSVFMPLMNTTIGFRTDRDPNKPVKQKDGSYKAPQPYSLDVVRDCIIDALSIGLLTTGNQMNIIAGRCYPTKEGYTSLLKKIGCKYIISVGQDGQKPDSPFAEIPCKINYDWNGDKGGYTFIATVKKDIYSSADQLRGKAERRAKKSLYEYLTGCDFGDADEESSIPNSAPNAGVQIGFEQKVPEPTQREVMNNAAEQAQNDWRAQKAAAENSQQAGPSF